MVTREEIEEIKQSMMLLEDDIPTSNNKPYISSQSPKNFYNGENDFDDIDNYIVNGEMPSQNTKRQNENFENYNENYNESITHNIDFIKNKYAKKAVRKLLERKLQLFSEEIQEIILLDEKINAYKLTTNELKIKCKKADDAGLEEAAIVFNNLYKELSAKIIYLEHLLKNINLSTNSMKNKYQ